MYASIDQQKQTDLFARLSRVRHFTADSNFFDEYGNEYNAVWAQMGKVKVESQGPSNRKSYKNGYLEKYMSLGIPMKLVITFGDVSPSSTTVMALHIKFSYRKGKGFDLYRA
jgi:hypothetical protein